MGRRRGTKIQPGDPSTKAAVGVGKGAVVIFLGWGSWRPEMEERLGEFRFLPVILRLATSPCLNQGRKTVAAGPTILARLGVD